LKIQQTLREETERHQTEVNSLRREITQLAADVKEVRKLNQELETDVNTLNEKLRTAKRVEDSLNEELQELHQKVFSGGRDSEHLKKVQSENAEFKAQILSLQQRLDSVSAQRDRFTREMTELQGQANETQRIEKEFGSVRAERDDLRKSTMGAQIIIAKLKTQVKDLTSRDSSELQQRLALVTQERDSFESQITSLRSQLDDTKGQIEIQATRLRTTEQNLQDAREDLEREQSHAHKHDADGRRLEDLLQTSRLRQAEMGKINATQHDEINTLNRRVKRLEGELEAIQGAHSRSSAPGDRALHTQLTLAKGQLADARAKLIQQERDFQQRLDEQNIKNGSLDSEKVELREEVDRLQKRQLESVQTKVKLEEQIRSLTRQITRLESDIKLADDAGDLTRLSTIKRELELVREDSEQKENKSQKHIKRLQKELETLRDHTEALGRELNRTRKESDRQSQLLRRQLQESRDSLKRFKVSDDGPLALTTQVEKRHTSELRGLGKQIRYLKAKLFREETFRLDLQCAKNFFLMQINCFES
jgi:chromosome segregation ATPase